MRKKRIYYFWITIIILFIGILSRKIDVIPLFVGDILYACLIYFGLHFLFPNLKIIKTTLLALLFCVIIEFFQLYKAQWIITIRNTTFGHYVLGQGFLWSDIVCYSIGVIISSLLDFKITTKTQN
ncbi:DUF2809 domain-containing protein, partial [Flavobacterium sp.]|uniref:ribosomal maturation YjgA family protein n=1 Tax=Flavobacterium sp. TaxID=239 RepID=UPI0037501A6B